MKDRKTGTLECKKKVQKLKISDVKNGETRKIGPLKLKSKKQAKKVVIEQEGFGWEVPSERLGSSHVLHKFSASSKVFEIKYNVFFF